MKMTKRNATPLLVAPIFVASAVLFAGCGGKSADGGKTEGGSSENTEITAPVPDLSGSVKLDGSSTVGPISEAVAETFNAANPKVKVSVGMSGTGGGFKKFVVGETDISDASRPIKSKEADTAKEKGVEFLEIPVAYDGLSVVINPKNTWAASLTLDELKKIWSADSKINNWSQVRAGFPNKPLKLYGPGTASGTFDYFVEEVLGKEGKSRADYNASEDDNALVQGVSQDEGGLGYFGFAYYEENASKLKLVSIDSGKGPVAPSTDSIRNGSYAPLSRPLFIYVSKKSFDRPEVKAYVNFYLDKAPELVSGVGYIALPENVYAAIKKRVEAGTTGSLYGGKIEGKSLESLYEVK
jgi:phosphate transport system substrate-binding protein